MGLDEGVSEDLVVLGSGVLLEDDGAGCPAGWRREGLGVSGRRVYLVVMRVCDVSVRCGGALY